MECNIVCSVNGLRYVCSVNGTPKKIMSRPLFWCTCGTLDVLVGLRKHQTKWGKRFEAWRLFTGPIQNSPKNRRPAFRRPLAARRWGGFAVPPARPRAPLPLPPSPFLPAAVFLCTWRVHFWPFSVCLIRTVLTSYHFFSRSWVLIYHLCARISTNPWHPIEALASVAVCLSACLWLFFLLSGVWIWGAIF